MYLLSSGDRELRFVELENNQVHGQRGETSVVQPRCWQRYEYRMSRQENDLLSWPLHVLGVPLLLVFEDIAPQFYYQNSHVSTGEHPQISWDSSFLFVWSLSQQAGWLPPCLLLESPVRDG